MVMIVYKITYHVFLLQPREVKLKLRNWNHLLVQVDGEHLQYGMEGDQQARIRNGKIESANPRNQTFLTQDMSSNYFGARFWASSATSRSGKFPQISQFFYLWVNKISSGWARSGKFPPKIPNFSIFYPLGKKSNWVESKKYPGQSWVGHLFSVSQKYGPSTKSIIWQQTTKSKKMKPQLRG